MTCDGCGNKAAVRIHVDRFGESCNACGTVSVSVGAPDVYFKEPYRDPHLVHPDRPNEVKAGGVWVTSKRHKAALMAEQNLVERGDKRGGARIEDRFLQQRAREQGHHP